MSYNHSVLHYSSEFIALCKAQIALLTQMMGATWSGIYLRESLVGTQTKLVPVVIYPKKEEIWESKEDRPRLPEVVNVSNNTLLNSPWGTSEEKSMVQPLQLVLPLMYNEVVIGLLITRRENQQWNEQELQQIDQIVKTIAIAAILEQRQQWYEGRLNEQETLQIIERDRLDDFIHQFRNPLTALHTFTKLLLKKLLPEDRNYGTAQSILRESDRLQELLEDFAARVDRVVPLKAIMPEVPLLSLPDTTAKSDTELIEQSFLVEEILQPLIISAQAIAQERGINLNADIPLNLPPIEANKKALREVLNNLIDNALKYTPRGGEVEVRIKQKEGKQGIEIADTGCGIPQEDQTHIFERHYRGVQAAGNIDGSGLGLAIAKELIDKMKGSIELISPNQLSNHQTSLGTSFIVWLPIRI
jgi:signal transduction histidine kinase